METKIIDGKFIASQIKEELKQEIQTKGLKPKMAVVLVGDDPASIIYVNAKKKAAEYVGIGIQVYHLSPIITMDALKSFIHDLNKDSGIHGIIVQLPLPKHLDSMQIINQIDKNKDIDGLNIENQGLLFLGAPNIIPCTPLGCMHLIKSVCPDLSGLNALVIGRSSLVGKPLAHLLLAENATITIAHAKTKNLPEIAKKADVLVSATGKAKMITKDYVKKGAIVIDVGISRLDNGLIVGDVDADSVKGQAGFLTPVPKGVGPMTIAMLLKNVLECYKKLEK